MGRNRRWSLMRLSIIRLRVDSGLDQAGRVEVVRHGQIF